jgi:hypothetical protein
MAVSCADAGKTGHEQHQKGRKGAGTGNRQYSTGPEQPLSGVVGLSFFDLGDDPQQSEPGLHHLSQQMQTPDFIPRGGVFLDLLNRQDPAIEVRHQSSGQTLGFHQAS